MIISISRSEVAAHLSASLTPCGLLSFYPISLVQSHKPIYLGKNLGFSLTSCHIRYFDVNDPLYSITCISSESNTIFDSCSHGKLLFFLSTLRCCRKRCLVEEQGYTKQELHCRQLSAYAQVLQYLANRAS